MPEKRPATPRPLSRYQRRVLWHLSQGYTVKGTAEALSTKRQAIVDSLFLIRRKTGCATNTQAVLRAYLNGDIGDWEDCGTRQTYVRHIKGNTDPCPACRRANAYWLERQADPPTEVRPLTDTQVKIIRSFHVGRTHAALMNQWGVSRGQLHRAVADMYRRLGVSEVPRELRREAALQIALEQGYLSPGAPRALTPVQGVKKHLTDREKEILRAVDGDVPLAEAAALLGMKIPSLSSRLTDIYYKLGVDYLPRKQKRSAALYEARRRGYAV